VRLSAKEIVIGSSKGFFCDFIINELYLGFLPTIQVYLMRICHLNQMGRFLIPFFFIRVTTNEDLASIRAWMSVMDLEIWY
jgi:hypothetical protein